jgi:hypothetical protein
MKQISLNKSSISLPDCWEDLNFKQKLFAFGILIRVMTGDLKSQPHTGLLNLLIEFTGYKPSRSKDELLHPGKVSDQREIINFNLLRLAEQIKFVFTIDEAGKKIIPQYGFSTNPIPYVRIGKTKYCGKRFELDITAKTDITAHEFADSFDLLATMDKMNTEADRQECINQLCAILYPRTGNYTQNMVSDHHKAMRQVNPVIRFAIMYWFTGIIKFYMEHPVYSLLFNNHREKEESEGKIRLGNEVILMLRREGYGLPDTMNLNDYFDAQIKHLKDVIGKALGEGLSAFKIAQKTGIPLSTIERLS